MIDLLITKDFHNNQDWRNNKPVWDKEKCVQCGICYLFCPDSAVSMDEEGYYQVDLDYCKGCGICVFECPRSAMVIEEERA